VVSVILLQAIWFQIIWFAAILGQNRLWLLLIALLLSHRLISHTWKTDIKILPIALLGFAGDLLLTALGVFDFAHFPFWLAAIWIGFALTLLYSMAWLERFNIYWQALIGGMAGCASYLAGARLEAVELPLGMWMTGTMLAAYWAVLLPSMLLVKKRLIRTPASP